MTDDVFTMSECVVCVYTMISVEGARRVLRVTAISRFSVKYARVVVLVERYVRLAPTGRVT